MIQRTAIAFHHPVAFWLGCLAVAAYKLGLICFYGVNMTANQPLGAAWMSIAANSRYTLPSYVSLSDTLTDKLDNTERGQADPDYARLRTKLGLAVE